MDELILVFETDSELDLIMDDSGSFELVMNDGGSAPPAYTGEYVVIPRIATEQVLATDGKLMTDDVTVREIPVTRTSNIYGGKTVVIG